MRGWSKTAIYLATVMIGLGFLLLVLAWNGAAGKGGDILGRDYTQEQFPFLLSGGLGGMALIGAGLAVIVIQSLRRDNAMLVAKLDELIDAVHRGGIGGGPTAVPDDVAERVVAGRTTYHRQSCHLIDGRTDLQVMSAATASDRGLAPCRVCEPDRAIA